MAMDHSRAYGVAGYRIDRLHTNFNEPFTDQELP
jgi:hypothetical protein